MSQPSLTQAIKRLEDELGGELIRRDGRYTQLTELGKSLRGHFEQIDRTRHMVRTTAKAVTSGEIAELNIGLMCTIGPRVLAKMLDTFQVEHPMVSMVLHDVAPPSIPDLLLSGALDGAFCARHGSPHPQLRYVELFEESMVVAFREGHALAELSAIPLREITKHSYVDRLHCEFRGEVRDLFKEEDLPLDVVFQSEREDWIQSLVGDGVGISCLPQYSPLSANIEFRPIVDPELTRQVEFAVVNQPLMPPALGMLIEHSIGHDWPTHKAATCTSD